MAVDFSERGWDGEAAADKYVSGNNRRPACVRYDAHPVTFRDWLRGKYRRRLTEFLFIMKTEDPGFFKDKVCCDIFF